MPIVLPDSFQAAIEKPHGTDEGLWFLEVELQRGTQLLPPVLLRICDGLEELAWPVGDPNSTVWYPYHFTFTPISQTQAGDLTQIELTVDNSTRTLMRFLHDGDGLEGNRVRMFLAFRNGLSIPYPNHEYERYDLEVVRAVANDDVVNFRLGMPNWFDINSPTDRYVPQRCSNEFGSPDCGYVLNEFAAFLRCSKLISACNARSVDMRTRGLPPILPGNFRGFPGISVSR